MDITQQPSAAIAQPSLLAMADLATPMAIRVCATLGLVDLAASGVATVEAMATRCAVDPALLGRLVAHLVTIGVFVTGEGTLRITPLGSQLAADSAEGIRPLLDIAAAGGRSELAFVDLLTTLTTGGSAYRHRYGADFWSDLESNPDLRRTFDAQMNWRFRGQIADMATGFAWSRFARLLDVGGGDGQLLTAIALAHPGLQGAVLEYGPTAEAAAERFRAAGVQDRCQAIAGNFFDPIPTDFDAYLLSDILHDWDDACAATILRRCADAAGPGGVVLVSEAILGVHTTTAMDLHLLMCFGGQERTVSALEQLAIASDLRLVGTAPISSRRIALEFVVVPS